MFSRIEIYNISPFRTSISLTVTGLATWRSHIIIAYNARALSDKNLESFFHCKI